LFNFLLKHNPITSDNIVRIIELTNDAGRLKKVEEFCGENLPTLIKIDDGVLYCHEELSRYEPFNVTILSIAFEKIRTSLDSS
jgi:hypothetical protein